MKSIGLGIAMTQKDSACGKSSSSSKRLNVKLRNEERSQPDELGGAGKIARLVCPPTNQAFPHRHIEIMKPKQEQLWTTKDVRQVVILPDDDWQLVVVSFTRDRAGERAMNAIERAHYRREILRARKRGGQFQTRGRASCMRYATILQACADNGDVRLRFPIKRDNERFETLRGVLVNTRALNRLETLDGVRGY